MNVLVLCTGNSARSILAEAILEETGAGRFRAFSAGSRPKTAPHPEALRLLSDLGYDTAFARSKSWREFLEPGAPRIDLVLTVCDGAAAEVCPAWPGAPLVGHIGIADPADPATAAEGDAAVRAAFRRAFHDLSARLEALVALPVEVMSAASLAEALAEIGAMPETAPDAVLAPPRARRRSAHGTIERETRTNAMLKPFVEISVSRLESHLPFYKALLGAEPIRHEGGLATFESSDPPMSLRVVQRADLRPKPPGNNGHFGIQMKSSAMLRDYLSRFEGIGMKLQVSQNEAECCGTVQNKLWVEDVDGNGWELFVVVDTAQDGGCGDEVESCKSCPCNFT